MSTIKQESLLSSNFFISWLCIDKWERIGLALY